MSINVNVNVEEQRIGLIHLVENASGPSPIVSVWNRGSEAWKPPCKHGAVATFRNLDLRKEYDF
jgi:hypothetical protein